MAQHGRLWIVACSDIVHFEHGLAAWQSGGRERDRHRLEPFDPVIGGGGSGGRFTPLAFGEPRVLTAAILCTLLARASQDSRHVAARALAATGCVAPLLPLDRDLCLTVDFAELPLRHIQVVLRRSQLDRLSLAIVFPIAAVARRAK